MLFTREALEDLLRLHELSYRLFRWVGSSLSSGSLSFKVAHGATDSAAAAEEWISRNLDGLPRELRPLRGDLVPLSHLFASFLTTSFVLPAAPRVYRDDTVCGCTCCTYLVSAHRLVLRNPTAKDRTQADKLQLLCLEALAESEGVPLSVELRRSVLADPLLDQGPRAPELRVRAAAPERVREPGHGRPRDLALDRVGERTAEEELRSGAREDSRGADAAGRGCTFRLRVTSDTGDPAWS